uniref:SpaA isopeptide-forming pilin-related protein n=1 Tax=Dysosmobacter sp. TaxID=2591382 RepID=UPI003AB32793
FYDKPLCNLTILKRDALTKKPLAKAEFIVKDSEGKPIGTDNGRFVTGSDGTVTITALNPNATVIVSEDKAPIGYIKDETPKTIVVRSGVPNSLTFDNEPSTTLVIHKYIEGTENEPLSGVAFKVVDGSGAAVGPDDGVYYTDKAGEIVLNGLEPGTTVVAREIKSVDGFVLDGTPQDILIKAGTVQSLTFWNKRQGALIINKLDAVTKKPLAGVTFKITTAAGEFVPDENGKISSNGLYYTDENGQIILKGVTGTLVVTEEKSIDGYTIDENTRTQTVVVNPNDTQTLHFYNDPVGGVEIIKVNEDNHSERIPNTTFEIRKVDDALVDTVTTDKNGRVFVALEDGSYYAKEVTSNKSFRLDDTPHYFEIKDGKHVALQVTNKKLSGIVIHKIDSATGDGIYGVKFVLYDADKKPIGEYTSDDRGYIYIDEIPGGLSGRFYLRELEAAPGYTLDKQYKTVYVSPGKTVEIEWENTAVTGQIQIYKYAAEYNEVTGTAPGTPLKGAVYEIVNARSGKVVDYITTDARGVAASKPLPLTRYQIREVTAPAYWQLDPTVHDVTLEYPGQIIKLSAYDKPSSLGVSITKRGNAQVMAGQSMRYDLTVANTSNVPLESFFWHDKIPYDVARPTTLTTGTYSARLNYRILYKTNYNASYQVLASNLLTGNNYSFALNAIPMQAGEMVTDIYFDFGKVPVGFQSVVNPTLSVMVNGNAVNGYQMVNRADVGGKYQGTWQTATASWVTIIRRLWNAPTLPKTGY